MVDELVQKQAYSPPFVLTEGQDLRELLIKQSIIWVFGRYSKDRPILYALFNRLLLVFQRPMSVIVYDDDLENVQRWADIKEELEVFRTLRVNKKLDEHLFGFGDQEIAQAFEKNFLRSSLVNEEKRPRDCVFKMFGTRYRIAFFRIIYDDTDWDIGKTQFGPVSRTDPTYGKILQRILEGDSKDNYLSFDPTLFLGSTFPQILEEKLSKQFDSFRTARKDKLEKQRLNDNDDKDYINRIIGNIRDEVVTPIFNKKIESSPFFVKAHVCEDGSSYNLLNAFYFMKTATSESVMSGYSLPYTVRLILSENQREDLRRHYVRLAQNKDLCLFYNAGRCCALKKSLKDNNQCIIESDKISATDIVDHAEKFFMQERDFIDTSMASGNFSFSVPYPDLSRSRCSSNLPESERYNERMSKRQAATLCLTLQSIRADKAALENKEVHLKAIAVPIHVGGISSVSILVVALDDPENEEKTWVDLYSLTLSSLVRTVNSKVRSGLKSTYLAELSTIFEEALIEYIRPGKSRNTWDVYIEDMVNEILERIHYVSHILPFPVVDFVHAGNHGEASVMVGETSINFSFNITGGFYFSRLFDYPYLKPKEVEAQFSLAVHRASSTINARKK
jgi:hypothetical protein